MVEAMRVYIAAWVVLLFYFLIDLFSFCSLVPFIQTKELVVERLTVGALNGLRDPANDNRRKKSL
jgi:hypothetical protein